MRLDGKVAIVVGAGQTPGDTIGNGRATAILFARRARACCSSTAMGPRRARPRPSSSAKMAGPIVFEADVTVEQACREMVRGVPGRLRTN